MEQPTDSTVTRAVNSTLDEHQKALVASVETVQTPVVSLDTPQPVQSPEETPAQQTTVVEPSQATAIMFSYTDPETNTETFLMQATAAFFARYSYMPDALILGHLRRLSLPASSWFQVIDEPEPIHVYSPGDQEIMTSVPVTADIPWDVCLVARLSMPPELHRQVML